MRSITTKMNVRFTANFTIVYTSPGPVHNQLPAAAALSAASQPMQQPQPPQLPQPPLAMSSGEEEVEVEDELKDSDLPTHPLQRHAKARLQRHRPCSQLASWHNSENPPQPFRESRPERELLEKTTWTSQNTRMMTRTALTGSSGRKRWIMRSAHSSMPALG